MFDATTAGCFVAAKERFLKDVLYFRRAHQRADSRGETPTHPLINGGNAEILAHSPYLIGRVRRGQAGKFSPAMEETVL
jgi:hypothetical protein